MLRKILSSYWLMVSLIIIYCIAMGGATFIERDHGAVVSKELVYHSIWFIALQLVMVVNALFVMVRRAMFTTQKLGSLTFHMGFVVVLIGAMTTHIFSREGVVHIREGQSTNIVHYANGQRNTLPMNITLDDFVLERYAGSSSPSSYESFVRVEYNGVESKGHIKMNKVLNIDGYRLFQQSYDPDEKGTILIVNYDFPGMQITYLGYILLLLGFLITPFQRGSRFRTLARKFQRLTAVVVLVLIWSSSSAQNHMPNIPSRHAKKFGELLVQNPKGRIEPMNSWSSQLLRKIHKSNSFQGLNSDEVLLGILMFPYEWSRTPLIPVENSRVREELGVDQEYVSYVQLFDKEGYYILDEQVNRAYELPSSQRNGYHKELISLDERVNIIYELLTGRMLAIFPHPYARVSDKWLSAADDLEGITGQDSLFISKILIMYQDEVHRATFSGDWSEADKIVGMINLYQEAKNQIDVDMHRVRAELKYNKYNIFARIFRLFLIAGGLLLVLCLYELLKNRSVRWLEWSFVAIIALGFVASSYGFAMRWYISSYPPWSNSYETMLFVSWSASLIGLTLAYRSRIVLALSSILAGVLLFVASLSWMSPDITPLVPVLKSPWLMLHVAIIMMGYGFFFISTLISLFNMIMGLFIHKRGNNTLMLSVEKCTILCEMAMILGTMLISLGIFIGAVWANESWGRYWGWDPKETWALITMMVYVLILHMRFVPKLNSLWIFNIATVWSIFSVLMTYFGVNYYLTGLHSYGSSGGSLFSPPVIISASLLLVLTITLCYKLKRR